jgi:glyoxylase-like metal-dependent hydrolase (beta-lactamase superfamily II)
LKPIPANQLIEVGHSDHIKIEDFAISAWHTPGHAKHHIAWLIGKDLFTGDVGGVCINGGPVIPPCPPPDINFEDWESSIEVIEELEDVQAFYLTHFGKVTDIEPHLKKLRQALVAYKSFAQPYHEKGMSVNDMLPEFRVFVQEYLTSNGMAPSDALAYEGANPSDMSAAGLLRYWKKRAQS